MTVAATELDGRANALAGDVIQKLHVVLRTVRIHDASNRAVATAVAELCAAIAALRGKLGGAVRIELVEDPVLLNDARLRASPILADLAETLRDELAAHGAGGFAFARDPEPEVLGAVLSALAHGRRPPAATERGIEVLAPKRLVDARGAEAIRTNRLQLALQAYARAVIGFRRAAPDREALSALVEAGCEHASTLLRVMAARRSEPTEDDPAANAAATVVYAILVGRVLGLDKPELHEIAGAVPFVSAEVLLQQPPVAAGYKRLLAALERRLPSPQAKLHALSRLFAVCETFDAFTTRAPVHTAEQALAALRRESGTRFDPIAVEALAALLGTGAAHARLGSIPRPKGP